MLFLKVSKFFEIVKSILHYIPIADIFAPHVMIVMSEKTKIRTYNHLDQLLV